MKGIKFKDDLFHFLQEMNNYFADFYLPIARTEGLTLMQAQLLCELYHHEGKLSVGQIRCLQREGSGNRSTLCKRMEQRGFLIRQRSRTDERCVVLYLTDQGRKAVCRMDAEIEARCTIFFSQISQQHLIDIAQSMDTLTQLTTRLTTYNAERAENND